jgi:hypothetical protein
MVDKTNGNAVGDMFFGSPKWQLVQEGSTENSLISQGIIASVKGPLVVFKIIVYSFAKGPEKPFVVDSHAGLGIFEIYSGTCK